MRVIFQDISPGGLTCWLLSPSSHTDGTDINYHPSGETVATDIAHVISPIGVFALLLGLAALIRRRRPAISHQHPSVALVAAGAVFIFIGAIYL
jgi:hypothetical protein